LQRAHFGRKHFVGQSIVNVIKFIGPAVLGLTLAGCAGQAVENADPKRPLAVDRNVGDVKISTRPLSVDNAVRLGILRSTEVVAAELDIRQKGNDITIARAGFYPELYANLSPSIDEDTFAVANAGIRYTLFDFGERAAKLNGSVAAIKGSQFDLIVEIEDSVEETLESYIAVSVENSRVDSAHDYVSSVRSLEQAVRGRAEIGLASSVDVNEVETALIQADTALIEARSEQSNAKDALASKLGVMPKSVVPISGVREALSTKKIPLSEIEFSSFPRIVSLQTKVEEAQYALAAASAGILPRIGVKLGVGVDLRKGEGINGTGLSAGPEISEVFSLGGGRKERVKNAEIDVSIAQSRRSEEIRLARLEAVQSVTSLNTSEQQVQQRKEILRLSIKTRDVMLSEYEVGTRSLRDLLDAEERIYEAQVDLDEARRKNLIAQLRYVMATNLASNKLYRAPK